MNKSELIEKIAARSSMPKTQIAHIIDMTINIVTESLQQEENVMLTGFGTFHIRHRTAHIGKHPRTGKDIAIHAAKIPVFKAGKILKKNLNNKI